MSSPVWKDRRCALCGRPRADDSHVAPLRPPLWRRLLSIAWPRHLWGHPSGSHAFVDRDRRVRLAAEMARLKRRRARRSG